MSIGFKIGAIVFPIAGIVFIFTEETLWWIGIILIVMGPAMWYASKTLFKKSKEWIEFAK